MGLLFYIYLFSNTPLNTVIIEYENLLFAICEYSLV